MTNLSRLLALSLSLPVAACAVDPGATSPDPSAPARVHREGGVAFDLTTGVVSADSPAPTMPAIGTVTTPEVLPPDASAQPDEIMGADGRTQVSPTTAYPARARVRIVVEFSDGYEADASGHMVGNKYVITAGHVVYSADHGGWATELFAFPGENGSSKPYAAMGVNFRTTEGWVDDQDDDVDYALVTLDSAVGNQTGWFGLATFSDDFFDNNPDVELAGYPADKPFGTQWGEAGPIVDNSDDCLFYNIDSAGGDSGAGIALDFNGSHVVTGVHHGTGYYWLSYYNQATRITNARLNQIVGWIQSGT
ncbi:MAG TPA: trypsin-like serine protease [Acidimicrobiia bacterium]|jgi:V8-like Glu-specific endopeptidase|nr:trypsin-like serine protease [Acidimicrobiia bacterium]